MAHVTCQTLPPSLLHVPRTRPFGFAGRHIISLWGKRQRCWAQPTLVGAGGQLCAASSAQQPLQPADSQGAVVGVVIVDHGSRRAESNEMLVEFGALYQQVTGRGIVEIAHMELAEPTIEQAVRSCVRRGAGKVIVAPYFLSRGRHIQTDIPALVADVRQQLPGVECIIAEPIGIDSLMAQLIERRVQAAERPQG